MLDQIFKRFEDLLVEAVSLGPGRRVLNVGSGSGGTTLAVARGLGAKGRCIGIDISDAMVAARSRAKREGTTAFICANAQAHTFEPTSFDIIISRFGVMFFVDSIRAFANLPKKNKKSHRTIALPDCLIAALLEHRANQDKIRKTRWAPDDFTDAYIAFSRRISTRDTRFHDLRHARSKSAKSFIFWR